MFSGAYTARAVLDVYLLWLPIILGTLVAAMVLIILGNIGIILSLRQTNDVSSKHTITALLGILTVCLLSTWGLIETAPVMRDVVRDVAAIENDELHTANYYIHLHWKGYYRRGTVRDIPGYEPLYVVRRDSLGRVYFPQSLDPTALNEMAAGEEYQLSGHAASLRMFEIRYTPNLQIIVDARPIPDTGGQ